MKLSNYRSFSERLAESLMRCGLLLMIYALLSVPQTEGKETIVGAGDSITHGYGVPQISTGVLQSDGLHVNFFDMGYGGICTAQYLGDAPFKSALHNYAEDVAKTNPDYVYFMLGTNDSFYSSDYLQSFQSNIDRIFATLKNGPRVIVATVLPQIYGEVQNLAIDQVINPALVYEANKFGYDLLDTHTLIQQQPNWQDFYAADGIHIWGPNGNGAGSRWLMHTFNSVVINYSAAANEWSGSISNDWHDPGNWSKNKTPGTGSEVRFGNQTSETGPIELGAAEIVIGTMEFTAGKSTNIQGASGALLLFENSGFRSTIDIEGSHGISVPIQLNSDLKISGEGSLTVGLISGNHSLLLQSGTLIASSIDVDTLTIGQASSSVTPVITVPEPSTLALLLTATLGGLIWWRRRA
jgi:lysophospholipase L1-like esterase